MSAEVTLDTTICGCELSSVKGSINTRDFFAALESLGFRTYVEECKEVMEECKHVAMKKRRGSSRLENLGIPEEELLRQQQELFAQARQQQLEQEQQEWLQHQMEMAKEGGTPPAGPSGS